MSSITATPSRNATSPGGTLLPSAASAPSAKATSVAMGMPHPSRALAAADDGEEDQRRHHHAADAANTGSSAAPRVDSSPTASSRFTSRPMTRKKIAIRPSLTRSRTVSSSWKLADLAAMTSVVQKSS